MVRAHQNCQLVSDVSSWLLECVAVSRSKRFFLKCCICSLQEELLLRKPLGFFSQILFLSTKL